LVGDELVQHETFFDYHPDWERRAAAGYVLFDSSPTLTKINVVKPLIVAEKNHNSLVEKWLSGNRRVRRLEKALFADLGITRRLRTTNVQRAHRHIALHDAPQIELANRRDTLERLRGQLLELV
jgi:hypothetical protein